MKIIIIGGAGFIGSHLAYRLIERPECSITLVDNMFRGRRDPFLNKIIDSDNVHFVEADLTDSKNFQQLDDDYDQVYMLASVVGVKYTEEIPDELIRINTSLILNTLEWLKNSQCKKVVFSSTSECYAGAIDSFDVKTPTDETVPLAVSDIRNPRFTYAVTKMLGEAGFFQYGAVHGFDVTIVRYHNVYGPRMGFKHVIPEVVKRFLAGEQNFKIYGAEQSRAFNFISDAVEGTIGAMESKEANGGIFHIGDMRAEIKIEELVRHIGQLVDYKGSYEMSDAPLGSVTRRCPDTTLAETTFGYYPRVKWQVGVKDTVDWYIDYLKRGGEVYE